MQPKQSATAARMVGVSSASGAADTANLASMAAVLT
jgi:hypothetical protein